MELQVCKEFLENILHGFGLVRNVGLEKYELVEYNQEFKRLLDLKNSSGAEFVSLIKSNPSDLSQSLLCGLETLAEEGLKEYVISTKKYKLVLNKQMFGDEEYITIMKSKATSARNYKSFIDSINEMILVSDKEGTIQYFNQAVIDKLGYSKHELRKMYAYELHPSEEEDREAVYKGILQKKKNICTIPILTKAGEYLYVETRIWFGEWNNKECVFALSKDISDELIAILKFQKTFYSNPSPMAIVSLTSKKFMEANEAFLQIYGFTREEIIGKTGIELNIFRESVNFERIYGRIVDLGCFTKEKFKTYDKDGNIVYGEFSCEIIESKGEKLLLISVNDITEQFKYEEDLKYRSKLQEILLDLSSRYINCSLDNYDKEINQSLEKVGNFVSADRVYIFDYNFEKGTTSNTFEWCEKAITPQIDFLHDIPLESIPDWVASHYIGETIIIKDVASLDNKTSSVKEILEAQGVKSLVTIPMMIENRCLGFVGFDSVKAHRIYTDGEIDLLKFYVQILVNIHMRKHHERELQEAKEKARKSNQSKNLFLAKTSHELRNPLNGAWGFLNLMDRSLPIEKNIEYVKHIKSSLGSAVRIANDLLNISKVESNDYKFEYRKINVHQLIDNAMRSYISQIEDQQIKLELRVDKSVPDNVVGDYYRLKEIIENLVSNALYHARASNIIVGCKVSNKEELILYVKDDGVGIAEEDQEKIFNYFYKSDNNSKGTGLGLAIIKELSERMGGRTLLESHVEKGSTFLVVLPLNIKEIEKSRNYDLEANTQSLSRLKIIMAEDDIINQELIKEIFKRKGMKIDVVSNGAELLMALEKNDFDLILMDIQMPIMGGIEATRKIRESNNRTPIIALTAAILVDEKRSYYSYGINGLVEKPINTEALMREIELVLKN